MFEGRDADNQFSDRQTICGAIVDWADDDEDLYACDPRGSSASGSKGAEDNFYLEGAAKRLQESLTKLGSDAEFTIVPHMGHGLHHPGWEAMMRVIEIKNWKTTSPLLNPALPPLRVTCPFSTRMGLKEERKKAG